MPCANIPRKGEDAMDLNVYNYLLTDFTSTKPSMKSNSHKDSELRTVLHDIAKKTKSSPLYLVKLSDKMQTYALNVKESSIALNDAFRTMMEQDSDSVLSRKKAVSSDDSQVGVDLLTEDFEDLPDPFEVQVKDLAKAQVNMSKEFYADSKSGLEAGTYRFKIGVGDISYDFQYNIRQNATHGEVMGGLSDFITKSKIGIDAMVVYPEDRKVAMRLEASRTGTPDGEAVLNFVDRPGEYAEGIVDYYGLNNIERMPENSLFSLDGEDKRTMGNSVVLGGLQLNLRNAGEEVAKIGYIPDSDKILEGVRNIADSYNAMVDSSRNYAENNGAKPRLIREMERVIRPFTNELESCGITFDEKGHMEVDDYLAEQAALEGSFNELFGSGSELGMRMLAKSNSIKVDPMEYVDKTLVTYPNTGKPPMGYSYTTSMYSGMLFNSYC